MSSSLAALLLFTALAPSAEPVTRLGALFAGGALDLMAEPRRDVTPSFAALISAPIGYPKEKRASVFTFLGLALPSSFRAPLPELLADAPRLSALCVKPDGEGQWKLEGLAEGRTRPWALSLVAWTRRFDTPEAEKHPPTFMLATVAPLKVTLAQRLQTNTEWGQVCRKLRRDAAGEIVFEGEQEPVRFEAPLGTPWPSGSEHLLDFVDDPDGAVAGLMPPEVFANLHPHLPQARAVGVRNLLATADALGSIPPVTVVAIPPTANGTAALFLEGRQAVITVGFSNGYFTPARLVTPAEAISGPWSKWSWSLFRQGMPAELLLDPTPASAGCLDALPRHAREELAQEVQRCFDLSLPDAGASFRARRERWLQAVTALEVSTSTRIDAFCADQGALAALPFFQAPAGAKNRDAGPLLTATLGWEDRKHKGTLKLPAALEQKFAGSGFMELSDQELAALDADTSFLSKLANFERWELADGKGALATSNTDNASTAPMPEFRKLTLAARLHLRRGLKSGKLLQAANDVRQAARLAFSTETMFGQLTGLSLLTIEWRAFDWARRHQLATAGWTPLDEETIARARRVVRTAPAFVSPMAKDETRARAQACDRVTRCAALTEVVAVSAGLETLLREPWRGRSGSVLETIARPTAPCSFALARHWSTRPLVDVAESKRSGTQEIIAGAVMSRAASGFYLAELETAYPPP